jgi:hypothetical protein
MGPPSYVRSVGDRNVFMRRISVIRSTMPSICALRDMCPTYFLSHQLNTILLVTQQKAARCHVPGSDIPSTGCVHQSRFLSAHTHKHTHYIKKWASLFSSVNPSSVVATLSSTRYSVQYKTANVRVALQRRVRVTIVAVGKKCITYSEFVCV